MNSRKIFTVTSPILYIAVQYVYVHACILVACNDRDGISLYSLTLHMDRSIKIDVCFSIVFNTIQGMQDVSYIVFGYIKS